MNPFALLGITPSFSLDFDRTESLYLDAQRKAQEEANLTHAAALNQAWNALIDPLFRARALFDVFAWAMQPESADLLQDVFDTKMELEATHVSSLHIWKSLLELQEVKAIKALEQGFKNHDVSLTSSGIHQLSYHRRLWKRWRERMEGTASSLSMHEPPHQHGTR